MILFHDQAWSFFSTGSPSKCIHLRLLVTSSRGRSPTFDQNVPFPTRCLGLFFLFPGYITSLPGPLDHSDEVKRVSLARKKQRSHAIRFPNRDLASSVASLKGVRASPAPPLPPGSLLSLVEFLSAAPSSFNTEQWGRRHSIQSSPLFFVFYSFKKNETKREGSGA